MTPLLVFITASSPEEARQLAKAFLEAKLAACVNLVPGVESHYWWEGKLEMGQEVLLIVKTHRGHLARLETLAKELHSYDCPEFVALEPGYVRADFKAWWLGALAS
jgi:periplasmic divalent cation tolerance protein